MTINFKKVRPDAIIPSFGNGDCNNAGLDLYACTPGRIIILEPGKTCVVDTGIAWEPVSGSRCAMIVQSRSGLAFKQGIEASNAGVIDMGYRDSIKVKLYNNGNANFVIEHGMRIAQGIVHLLPEIAKIVEMEELGLSVRGTNGFGSTGR